jgi:hypothetical protein
MTVPRVDIVIVNWNAGPWLRDCLESLAACDQGDIARVTVVDNASADGSADGLDDLPLPLETIRNRRNVGFAAACNQGAARGTSEYLLFLNPDTRLFPDTLRTVVRFMSSDEGAGVGICGVEIVDGAGHLTISCSRFPTLRIVFGRMTGLDRVAPRLLPSQHMAPAELVESRPVDQVIGAFYLVRRHLFTAAGGFDERYFMYFEDVDLAERLSRAGWLHVYAPSAVVVHEGGHATSREPHRMQRVHHTSALRYLSGQYPGRLRAPLRGALRAGLGARMLVSYVSGRVAAGARFQRRAGDLPAPPVPTPEASREDRRCGTR